MASEVGCWEVLDRLNNNLKIQQADLSRWVDLGTRSNCGGQWARLSRTFLWNHPHSVHTGFPKCSSIRSGQISSNAWWCTRTALFFTTASGKRFVATSQLHDALTKALTECFFVNSTVHLSSLRRMGDVSCALGECRAYQGCLPYLVVPQHPQALRGHCEVIKVVPYPTLLSARRCVVVSWCRELESAAPHKDGHMHRLLHEVTNSLVG